jgi:hypothetical protein
MPLSKGEQYAAFLLLSAPRSILRQTIEGSHAPSGSVVGAPGPAADAQTLGVRAATALAAAGVDADNIQGLPLNALFDANGVNNLTTDPTRVAAALAMADYGGTCPDGAIQRGITSGIVSELG